MEIDWKNLIDNLFVPFITLVLMPFIVKWAATRGAKKAVEPVQNQVEQLDKGQLHILKEVNEVKSTGISSAKEMDGRLTEYRRLLEAKAVVDVAAALVEGKKQGAEEERRVAEEKAKEVLATEKKTT